MKATKQLTSTHQRLVVELINAVEDRDIQEEMFYINKQYLQVLAGLRLAYTNLEDIDNTCGTEHGEIMGDILNLIKQAKASEISLLDMASSMEEVK